MIALKLDHGTQLTYYVSPGSVDVIRVQAHAKCWTISVRVGSDWYTYSQHIRTEAEVKLQVATLHAQLGWS